MKIVALQGIGGVGKTATLKILIQKMLSSGHTLIAKKSGKSDDWALFKVKEKFVGISTKGDSDTAIKNHLEKIMKYTDVLDVFICAAHTYGKTENFIKTKSNGNYILCGKLTFDSPNSSLNVAEQKKQNEWQAEYLCSLI